MPDAPARSITLAKGQAGLSAYELAVSRGFPGSLEDWLGDLQGSTGPKGLGLKNRGDWSSGETYNPNDYVFADGSIGGTSAWLVRWLVPFISTTEPNVDDTHWLEMPDPALGGVTPTRAINTQYSLTGGGNLSADRTLNLVGDVALPGNSKVYGTNVIGVRGWYASAGGGDLSSNTATSVVGEILEFADTSGKLAKRSTGTGLAKLTSGVLSTTSDNSSNWDTAYSDRLKWDGGATGLVAATARASLSLEVGSDVQAFDPDLDALAALAGTHTIYYRSATSTWSAVTIGTGLDFTGATLSSTVTGTGDVISDESSSTDSQLPLFASTTGKHIKKSTGSGLVKVTSGVVSTITDSSTNWDSAFTDRLKWDGGATGLVAATGRTSLGATTVGSNLLTLPDPGAIVFLRINTDNSVTVLNAANFRASIGTVIGTNVQAWDADLDTWATKTPYAGTLTITTGKTFNVTNTLTLSGTDGSTLAIGTGGTLGTAAYTSSGDYQPIDSDLTTISGLTATTDNFLVSVSSAWASRTPSQVRTTLGLVVGTNIQAWDTQLDSLAGLAYTGNALKIVRVNAGETAFELASPSASVAWGGITGTLSDQTDLQSSLDGKQPLDSDLTTLAGLTATTDNFIVSVSSAWASRTPSQVRTTLGLVIGTNVQAWDADLDTWAGKTPYAGTLTITTGKTFDVTNSLTLSGTDGSTLAIGTGGTLGTAAYTASSAYQPIDTDLTTIAGLTATTDNFIVSVASAWASRTPAQVRTTLGLVIGTNVQAWDADLDAWAGVATSAKANSGANTDITSVLLNQTGLAVKGGDANALTIKLNETLTLGRTLNIKVNNVSRTIDLSGDLTVPSAAIISGTNTGDQASIVGITGSLSDFNTALTGADFATGGGTVTGASSGTNTGDQTSIVGITGTKAQFDTSVTDGNILYVGDVSQYTDELAQDAVGAMVDASLTYVDATPLLQRAALTGAITASAGSNATVLGSFTTAALNTALSDNDIATGGGTATGTNTGDQTSVTGNAGTATALQNARTIGGVSFDGTANIVPQTIQSINEATDTTCFPLFISASGSQSLQPLNNTALTFNSNTGALGATSFVGAGTGLTGTAASLTSGNVTTNANLTGHVTSSGNAAVLGSFTLAQLSTAVSDADIARTDAANTFAGTQTFNGAIVMAAGTTSLSPFNMPSGTLLTTPVAGDHEFDGTGFYKTIDTTNGRGHSVVEHVYRLTANQSAVGGSGIADFFPTGSAIPTVTNGSYEITFYVYFLKTTAGSVTWTITNTQTYTNIAANFIGGPAAGLAGSGAHIGAGIVGTTTAAAALPGTASLTDATNHRHIIQAVVDAGTAGNIRLRVTPSAGSVTPLRGSYIKVRRFTAGNVGTFAS